MKQCSLLSMFSRPVPVVATVHSNHQDAKENEQETSAPDIVSSDSNGSDIPTKNVGIIQNKCNEKKISKTQRKRLKLAKQEKSNDTKKTSALTDINKIPMASEKDTTSELLKNRLKSDLNQHEEKEETTHVEEKKTSTPETSPLSKCHSSSSKESLSYLDFLNLFQSSSCDNTSASEEPKQETPENMENESSRDNGPKLDIVNCRSISSYFKSSHSKKGEQKTKSPLVTVTAEIHASSTPKKVSSPTSEGNDSLEILSIESNIKLNKAIQDESEDIVLLSSEIIDNDSESLQKQNFGKGRCSKNKNNTKKVIINAITKQTPGDKISSSSSAVNIVDDGLSENSRSLQHSSFQQSTLSFGKFGLSIARSEKKAVGSDEMISNQPEEDGEVYAETSVEKPAHSAFSDTPKEPQLESKSNEGQPNSLHEPMESNVNMKNEKKKTSRGTKSEQEHVLKNQNKKGHASQLIKDDVTETKNPVDEQGQSDAPSTPVLRRSSRIKENFQTMKEIQVLEIDIDDGGEKVATKKPKNFKEQTLKSNAEKVCAKPSGKLASIFMRGKAVEEEPKKNEPPEDPEKARARREFLMSGIPDELKRVMAATALTNVEADYPPFPQQSHVQQISSQTLPSAEMSNNNFRSVPEEKKKFDVSWTKLSWSYHKVNSALDQCDQDFSGTPVDASQTNTLLGEMELLDPTFPFRDTFNALIRQKNLENNRFVPSSEEAADIVVIDDVSPTIEKNTVSLSSDATRDFLWCDLYQPSCSQEILGNTKTVRQLKEWLIEWHNLMQKEVQKAAKAKKSQQRSSKQDMDWSDDSDFTDSDEDDCRLCNTMLITGPHGIGKTSTVYGLAQEVGFKVFEVSASSLRSGKQLLSQLEEATQSHRVVSNKDFDLEVKGTPPAGTSKSNDVKPASTKTHKTKTASNSAAFANLFKGASNSAETSRKSKTNVEETEKKKQSDSSHKKSKKRKAKEDVDVGTKTNRALNITSTSLILFDEADVVFEEDKGFLSTVQHFMASTKIPIILTSTDPSLHLQLSLRHHNIILKEPSLKSTVGLLYTVCLANGICVDYSSLSNMVKFLKGDIRQCLLQLQFWCQSGGGRRRVKESSGKHFIHQNTLPTQDLCHVIKDITAVDSQSGKPHRKRPRMIIDDDSNSSAPISDQESVGEMVSSLSQLEKPKKLKRKMKGDKELSSKCRLNEKSTVKRPLVHYGCEASLVGESFQDVSTNELVNLLQKANFDSSSQFSSVVTHYETLRRHLFRDILYSYALRCCDLPLTCQVSTALEIHTGKYTKHSSGKRKRKRILSDCFDSEASSDEEEDNAKDKSLDDPSNPTNDGKEESSYCQSMIQDKFGTSSNDTDVMQSDDRKVESVEEGRNQQEKRYRKKTGPEKGSSDDNLFSAKVLSRFSSLYDDRSCVSLMEDVLNRDHLESALKPGVEDQLTADEGLPWKTENALQDIYSWMDVLSTRTFVSSIGDCVREYKEKQEEVSCERAWNEEWDLPVGASLPDLWGSLREKEQHPSDEDATVRTIKENLGLLAFGSNPCIHTDYLPTLREICRFESERQVENKKRRFHHYFDHISLGLKEPTIARLASTYTVIE